jgi:RimJ/RimL family protein N-acetyltransferase
MLLPRRGRPPSVVPGRVEDRRSPLASPRLSTPRLDLEPLLPEALAEVRAVWTDPDVRRYLFDDRVVSTERARELLEASARDFGERGFGLWALHSRLAEPLIGFCGLAQPPGALEPQLMYGLVPAYWGRGLATEAARAVLEHGFGELAVRVVAANTDAANAASVRVLERLGMRLARRALFRGLDLIYFRLTAEDFRRRSGVA